MRRPWIFLLVIAAIVAAYVWVFVWTDEVTPQAPVRPPAVGTPPAPADAG